MARLFMGGYKGLDWPDFNGLVNTAHSSFGYGPLYRGRPDQATILAFCDQQSHDDMFTYRALTGDAGQRFQAFLKTIGIDKSYCILRVFPVDTIDLTAGKKTEIAKHEQVIRIYDAILKKILGNNNTKLIFSLGTVSGILLNKLHTGGVDVIKLKAWKDPGAKENWLAAFPEIRNLPFVRDIPNPNYNFNGERVQIPRRDLPYGMLKWQGSSGDRARRANLPDGTASSDYYKFLLPDWTFKIKPEPLSAAEQKAVQNHP